MKFLELFGCKRRPRTETAFAPPASNGAASHRGPSVPSLEMVIPAAIAEKAMFALIELLRDEAASTEGLFKVSAPPQDVYLLKSEIETELAQVEAAKSLFSTPLASGKQPEQPWKKKALAQPHAAASVLKVYLSQLPEPLFTYEKYQMLLNTQDLGTEDERLDGVLSVLGELPEKNKALLGRLMALLHAVKSASRRSHMSSGTLAAVFALEGYLLRPRENPSTPRPSGTAAVADPREARLLQLMIDKFPSMFESPLSQPSSPKHRRNLSSASTSMGIAPTLLLTPEARRASISPKAARAAQDSAAQAGEEPQPAPAHADHAWDGPADGREDGHPPTQPPDGYDPNSYYTQGEGGYGYAEGEWDGANGHGHGGYGGEGHGYDGAYHGMAEQDGIEGESGSVREFPGREGGQYADYYDGADAAVNASLDRASLRSRATGTDGFGSPGGPSVPHCSRTQDGDGSLRMWDTETRDASVASAAAPDAALPLKRRTRRSRSRRRRGAGGRRSDHERSQPPASPDNVVRILGLPEIRVPAITNKIRQNEALWRAVRRALAEREARRQRRRGAGASPSRRHGAASTRASSCRRPRGAGRPRGAPLGGGLRGGGGRAARAHSSSPARRGLEEGRLEERLRALKEETEREAGRFGYRRRADDPARGLSQRLEDALWAAIRDWHDKGPPPPGWRGQDARVAVARAVRLFPALEPPDRAHALLSVLCALQAERARLMPASPDQSFASYESPRARGAAAGDREGGLVPVSGLREEDIAAIVPILKGHLTVVEMAADGPPALPRLGAPRGRGRSPPKQPQSAPRGSPPRGARSPPKNRI
eukprot:tig00020938_g16138.t1